MTAEVVAWNGADDDVDEDDEVAADDVVVVAPVVGVVAATGGALTVNCVPVTTVTWAPSVVGPRAVMTDPDIEWATA